MNGDMHEVLNSTRFPSRRAAPSSDAHLTSLYLTSLPNADNDNNLHLSGLTKSRCISNTAALAACNQVALIWVDFGCDVVYWVAS